MEPLPRRVISCKCPWHPSRVRGLCRAVKLALSLSDKTALHPSPCPACDFFQIHLGQQKPSNRLLATVLWCAHCLPVPWASTPVALKPAYIPVLGPLVETRASPDKPSPPLLGPPRGRLQAHKRPLLGRWLLPSGPLWQGCAIPATWPGAYHAGG